MILLLKNPQRTHIFKKSVQRASVQGAGEMIEDKQESSYIRLYIRNTIQFPNSRGTEKYVRI